MSRWSSRQLTLVAEAGSAASDAGADINAAVDYCASEAGPVVARRFIDAVEQGLGHVGRHPGLGAVSFAYHLDIPELRTWPLPKFAHVICYVECETRVDVWRILHGGRDFPSVLADETDT